MPNKTSVINHVTSGDVLDDLSQQPKRLSPKYFYDAAGSELFEQMPEVGDLDKPKLVFFFDEAHLLFEEANKSFLDQIEMVVRLVRSKGVGVYFVTQSPEDVPPKVLAWWPGWRSFSTPTDIPCSMAPASPPSKKFTRTLPSNLKP